jgi:hypothetical protein
MSRAMVTGRLILFRLSTNILRSTVKYIITASKR